jgi:hypothetical protein
MQILVKSNYREIHQPLPGNPLATIGNPLAIIGKLPTIGKLTIEAKGVSGTLLYEMPSNPKGKNFV